ncbi:hypothetical protein V9T40_006839, partial [Parthenolecanium corni]
KQKYNLDNLPRLILLSGRTAEGLGQVLKKIEFDSFNEDTVTLINEVFHKNMPFHIYRGFTILPKTEKMTAVLDESGSPKRPVCFIFSGMGSQWNGMGKHLLDLPIIAEVIKLCDEVLRPKSIDIYKVLLSEDPTMFDDITMSFVGIICMQIALVEVLKKLNIVPGLILGHSVGEMGCAYADGCITLEQAVLGSYARGIASTSIKTIRGMMAAVGQGYDEIKNNLPPSIQVACHNAINSCTLSGPASDVEVFVEKLKKQGIFAKSVNVANIAYHSQYIAPAAPKLLQLLKRTIPEPKKRSSKWISSSIPESEWHLPLAHQCSAEYLTNNLLKPVLFEEACRHIPKDAICVEIAPHGLLQAILKRSLPEACTNISLTLRSTKKDNLNYLLSGIGKLYVEGCEPAVNNLYPSIKFPVSRGTPSISPYCTWFHGDINEIHPPYWKPKVIKVCVIEMSQTDVSSDVDQNLFGKADCTKTLHLTSFFLQLSTEFHGKFEWRQNWVTFLDSIMKFHMFPDLRKSKLCFLNSIRRMVINPSTLNSQESGYQTHGKYNPVTNSFQCNGIEIHDVQWKINNRLKASKSSSSLKIRKMKFISYNNPSCQGPEEFVDICTQISLEALKLSNKLNSKIFVCDYTRKFTKNIQVNEMFQHSADKLAHAPVIREGNTTDCPLSSSMERCNGKNEIVIRRQLDSTSLTLMFSKKKRHSIKYLFVSKTPDSTNNIESRLLLVALCNLPKSVLKNQDWGSYIYLPTNHISSVDKIADNKQYINNIQHKNVTLLQNKQRGIEYSGFGVTEDKIMGLMSARLSIPTSKVDPILTWMVPDEWTLAEAVTVPVVYAHAYSIMRIIERSLYRPTLTVVIITDSKNIFSKSLITLFLMKNVQIYIVTPDECNVTDLQSEFSSLNRSNFIIPTNGNFDHIVLLKTKGKGANVLVNFLPGSRNVISSMNCISCMSQVIETVESNMNEDTELGLYPFLKFCSFFVIPCRITYILNLPDIEKMYLQKAIEEGISSGLVKPVPQKPNTVAVGKLKECNGDACLKMIEYLRKKDASNFVVILEKLSTNSRILAQMNQLLSDKNIIISFKTLNKLNSQGDFDQLIAETIQLAPLDSVFFVSVNLNTIQKTGPVTLIGETWNAAVAIELSTMIKKSGRDYKLFILEGDPIEWKNTINNLNLTNHREFENILTELYGDKILEHLYPQQVEAEDQHHPIKIISNGNQPVNSEHVHRCLRLLKQQLINAHKYSLNQNMIENTVFFSKQVTHNTTLALSNSSDVIHINEDGYDRFIQSSAIKKIINKQAMFAWL